MTISGASGEQCEDIKGTEKWSSEGHGDNNPSTKKFDKMIFEEDATTCEVAEAIDLMKAKGEIEDHQWDEFKETFVYQGTSEDVQDCFKHRFNLPDDDGDKRLAGYEIQKCATGSY